MPKKTERGAIIATPHSNNSTNLTITQNEKILEHLQLYGSITSMTAFKRYEITRLSGRIYDLRKQGHNIETIYETSQYGSRYGRYVLHEEEIA